MMSPSLENNLLVQHLEAQIGSDVIFKSWKYFQSVEVKSTALENWDTATKISEESLLVYTIRAIDEPQRELLWDSDC